MTTVVQIKIATPGGIVRYCKGLGEILRDVPDLDILVPDVEEQPSRLFHYSYDKDELRRCFADADIVHINGYTAQGTIDAFNVAHEMGRKIVYTAHWHPFQCLAHPFFGKWFFNLRLKHLIEDYADVVVTLNNEDTAFFKAFHPNVVQIQHWYNPKTAVDRVERNPKMILFVGPVNYHVKNFHQLLALPEGQYEVHCVGKGEMPVKRSDFIHHANIPEQKLMTLYRQASLLVVPSKYEAFSFVSLEALVHGTPVVMSDRVRIADYLTGVNGYSVFRYGDDEGFLTAVRNTIGTSVDVDKVKQIFDAEEIAQKYKKLYLSLAESL